MKPFPVLISVLTAFFMIISCNLTGSSEIDGLDEVIPDEASSVSHEDVDQDVITIEQSTGGSYSFEERTDLTIQDEEYFSEFWNNLHANTAPVPELPSVDFTEYTVVAVMMGVQPTGGYQITITDVSLDNNTLYIEVEEAAPGSGCMTTQALTSPYHVVKIPVTDASDIRFITKHVETDC
jgi:hypothetical protein